MVRVAASALVGLMQEDLALAAFEILMNVSGLSSDVK